LGPPLARRLARLLAAYEPRGGGLEAVLGSSTATPFPALLEAYRKDIGLRDDDPRMESIGEAALAFYLYVRTQDDIVDAPETCDRGCVYLAEVFEGASLAAFARSLDGDTAAAFFAFRAETMRAFSEFAARDLDTRGVNLNAGTNGRRRESSDASACGYEGDGAGLKFLPLAVLLAAVAFAAGRAEQRAALVRFSTLLGAGLQAVNDLLNSAEDHANKATTPVLRELYRLGPVTADAAPANARWSLLASPLPRRTVARARELMLGAAVVAEGIGAVELASVARRRAEGLAAVPRWLLSVAFDRRF
ncbi:MAG TPA: hypothetical protein VGV38_09265, partial [Pyrinomonadaceae bacterium]|nr:hypothetical protein [Pyrinomonadaceae bacterium]